jgi:hypothetical protein
MRRICSLVLGAAVIFASWSAGAADALVEIPLWKGPGAESDPRVVYIDGHPCGEVAFARVKELPEVDSKVLEPEKVLEITSTGERLRIWSAPVDSYPVAIDGDFLIARLGYSYYRIGIDRSIRLLDSAPGTAELGELEHQPCPALEDFGESVFVRCAKFANANGGAPRVLAFQGVCT